MKAQIKEEQEDVKTLDGVLQEDIVQDKVNVLHSLME